jgi:hypothetical protein
VDSQALLLIIIWPGIVGFTAAGTFFVIKYQQQIIQQLNTGFGSTICLSFINIISSQLVSFSTDLEEWHPNVRTNVSLYTRLVSGSLRPKIRPLHCSGRLEPPAHGQMSSLQCICNAALAGYLKLEVESDFDRTLQSLHTV